MKYSRSMRKRLLICTAIALGTAVVLLLGFASLAKLVFHNVESETENQRGELFDFALSQSMVLDRAVRRYYVDHQRFPGGANYAGPLPYGALTTPIGYIETAYVEDLLIDASEDHPLPVDPYGPPERSAVGCVKQSVCTFRGADFAYATYGNRFYAILSRGPDGSFQFDPGRFSHLSTDDERTSYILSIALESENVKSADPVGDLVSWGDRDLALKWHSRRAR